MNNSELFTLITQTKQALQEARADLLNTLEHIPDDKLHWSPSDTARTPLWIVGHCAGGNQAAAMAMREGRLPLPADAGMEEAMAMIWNAGRDVTSRAEAVRRIETSTEELIAALDAMTPERLETVIRAPFGEIPMPVWIAFPAEHMRGHARQLDYLQTTWGDLEVRM